MPGWGWAILVVLMVVGIAGGLFYAFRRFRAAMRMVGALGSAVEKRMDRMAAATAPGKGAEAPAFTQPLDASVKRYEAAHEDVVRRREAKRLRHPEAWARWSDMD